MNRRIRPSLGSFQKQISKDVTADVEPKGDVVILRRENDVEAHVHKDGTYYIIFDSHVMARHYMEKNEIRTAQVQDHWRSYGRRIKPDHPESWLTYLEHWINEHPYRTWGERDVYPGGRQGWTTAPFESGNTSSFGEDCWLGEDFIYAHFYIPGGEEGAVIMWHLGGDIRGNYADPEVWIGDFEGFMNEQSHCDWYEPDGFINWNNVFDGGLIWALKEMGSFDGDTKVIPVVYKAIIEEPKIAFDIGILENERAFPPEVVAAVKKAAAKYGG